MFGLSAGQLAQLLGNSLLTLLDDTADTGIRDSKGVYKPLRGLQLLIRSIGNVQDWILELMGFSKTSITRKPKMYRGIGDVSQLPVVQGGDFACPLLGKASLWKPIHETANNAGVPEPDTKLYRQFLACQYWLQSLESGSCSN